MSDLSVRAWMTPAPSIGPKESLKKARALMRRAKVAELLVVDDGKLVGTLCERDIWEHCPTSTLLLDESQAEELLDQMRAGGVMALHPPSITPETSVYDAAQIFAQLDRPGLPVVEDGLPVGLLTKDTLVQVMANILKSAEEHPIKRRPESDE